ncbi:hypothetical protein D3C76_1206820 [compost metagenome]
MLQQHGVPLGGGDLLQTLQIAEQAAIGLGLPKPLGLLRQPESELLTECLPFSVVGLRQCLAPQGPLLHQPIFGKQLLLLGRGEALPAQLLTLVKQQLQAGEAGIRRHRQAGLRRQEALIATQQRVFFVCLASLQALGQLVAQGSLLGGGIQGWLRTRAERQHSKQQGRAQQCQYQHAPVHSPNPCRRLACWRYRVTGSVSNR